MSTHSVQVVEITQVLPHGNAERLEIVPVNGWQAVIRKGEFKVGDRAVYIEPDYLVPTDRPEFAFLARDGKTKHRLKAVRLRGEISFGLLIPLPAELADVAVGDNVMDALGIERYVPKPHSRGGKVLPSNALPEAEWPKIGTPYFDLENLRKFPDAFAADEPVIITEKIHGANARYLWHDGVFYIGSRKRWLKPDDNNIWKQAADNDPRIETWCRAHPDVVLYGEVYGNVQSLKYGLDDTVAFVAFAAYNSARHAWLSTTLLHYAYDLPTAPVLYRGLFNMEKVIELAELDSAIPTAPAGHMSEGVVVVSAEEGFDRRFGRKALKHISNRYWLS